MNNGKYTRKRRLRWRKEFVLLCSIAILLIGMVGGSLAYLFMGTDAVTNTFTAPEIGVTIPEHFDKDVKKDVKVTNSCDFPVYARATYVVYWLDENGNVVPTKPVEGIDYTISIGDDWEQNGDYWYYNQLLGVDENSTSTDFIVLCQELENGGNAQKYKLVVDVIGEVVQAEPVDAVTELWGFVPSVS